MIIQPDNATVPTLTAELLTFRVMLKLYALLSMSESVNIAMECTDQITFVMCTFFKGQDTL